MKKNEVKNNSNKRKVIIGIIILLILIAILLWFLLNRNAKYEVSFDSNGGSYVASIIVDENGLATKPEDPTRENYVFAGWYYNDELFDFSKPITGDIKLEARWVETGRVAGIELEQKNLTLKIDDEVKLNAIIKPEDALDKTVTWSSSDTNIVSVDSNGNIKALKEGTATITVTTKDGEFTAKVEITVNNKENEDIKGSDKEDDNSNKNTGTSADKNPGSSTNKNPGSSTEEPTTPSEEKTVKVTGVSLNKTNLRLYINESTKLTANIKPNNASNKQVTWASSNPSVATVDANGNVKALKEGTATITVTTKDGNKKAECTVTVSKKADNYIVTLTTHAMEGTGSKMQYIVSVTKNGSPFSTSNYKWVIYNGTAAKTTVQSEKYDRSQKTAKILFKDGTSVTATVVYK